MYRLALIVISAFALMPSPAWAKDSKAAVWIVSQLSGDARIVRNGLQPAALKANARLSPGDMVVTGASGRATLVHGADYIVIAPRTEMRLPTEAQPTGFTRVIQNLGTMLFKVQHTGVPHFAVDTPMLAAVVKGTTFTVVVDQNRSAVQVIQGVVQVRAAEGGMSRLVEGGRTVFVNRSDPARLIEADSPAAAAPTSTSVRITGTSGPSVATIAALTNGLVRPGAAVSKPTLQATSATATAGTKSTDDVLGSMLAPVTEPVTDTAAAVSPVSQPIADAADPVTGPVTQPVSDGIDAVAAPATQAVTDVADTVTAPVTQVVDSVTAPVTQVVDTVTAPVTQVVDTVTAPVTQVVDTVTAPVTDVVNTVVAPLTQPVTDVVNTVVAPVTQPVTNVVNTIVPPVTQPVTNVVDAVVAPLTNLFGGH